MSERNDTQSLVGCLLALAALAIQLPLWACLMFGILDASGAPTWCWVLFWIYVPVCVVLGVIRAIAEAALS